jgi:hypothetical protein
MAYIILLQFLKLGVGVGEGFLQTTFLLLHFRHLCGKLVSIGVKFVDLVQETYAIADDAVSG